MPSVSSPILIALLLLAAGRSRDGAAAAPPSDDASSRTERRALKSSSSDDGGPKNVYHYLRQFLRDVADRDHSDSEDDSSFDETFDVDSSGAFKFDGIKRITNSSSLSLGKKESKFGFVKLVGRMGDSKRDDYDDAVKTKRRGKLSGAIAYGDLAEDDSMSIKVFEDEEELTFERYDVPGGRKAVVGPRDGGGGGGGSGRNETGRNGWTGVYRPPPPGGFGDNTSSSSAPVYMNMVRHPVTGGVCGSFVRDDLSYNLKTLPDGTIDVNVIDVSEYRPGNPPLVVPGGTRRLTSRELRELLRRRVESTASSYVVGPDDDGSNVDVMVVYTRRTMCVEAELDYPCDPTSANVAPIELLIDLAFRETNAAFANSGVTTTLRNVRTYMHPTLDELSPGYTFESMLTSLRDPNDGIMDDVHDERESSGADLVSLFVESSTSANDGCGLAYQYANDRSGGFSLVKRECATGEMIFGHEIGHNFGCLHNEDDDHTNANSAATSHGYRDPSSRFRTIMSYDCPDRTCPPVPYYSNPVSTHDGRPVGDAAHDCANQINAVTPIVASFETIADYDPTSSPTDAPSSEPTKSDRPSSSFMPSQSPTTTGRPTGIPVIEWPLCYKRCKVQR